jgi:DNA-binding transcriptional ArsR family regulator
VGLSVYAYSVIFVAMTSNAWAALAEPHRRAMLALLLERPRVVGELVERLGLSQPGTSKHLRVLRDAGLVRVRRDAQRRVYELEAAPLAELDAWLAPYREQWKQSLDDLERHLDRTSTKED